MAFSTDANSVRAVLTGANQTIPVGFPFFETTNLVVRKQAVGATATTLLAEGTHYSVLGGDGSNGSVVMKGGSAGETIFIKRAIPIAQPLSFDASGEFDMVGLEKTLDRLGCIIADLKAVTGKYVRLSDASVDVDEVELLAGEVAGKFAGFDAAGNFTGMAREAAIAILNLPETVVDLPQKVFANAAARALAVPDFVGQMGIQLDKVSDPLNGGVWIGSATTAGSWASMAVTIGSIANSLITGAKLAAGSVGPTQLVANAVTSSAIAAGAVGTAALADGSATTAKLADGGVTSAKLASGAVTAAKLASGAVGTTALVNGAVTSDKLAAASVSSDAIVAGAVGEDKLGDGIISTAKLKSSSVTAEKLASGSVTNEKLALDVLWRAWEKYFRLELQATSGTGGGSFTAGAMRTRGPFTEVFDMADLVSISGNQFTLQPGTYYLRGGALAYRVDGHKVVLYDVTAGQVVGVGMPAKALDLAASSISNGSQSISEFATKLTLTVATTYELRHQCELTNSGSTGMGRPTGWAMEVFGYVEGWRIL